MSTLRMDGALKAIAGLTTPEEVLLTTAESELDHDRSTHTKASRKSGKNITWRSRRRVPKALRQLLRGDGVDGHLEQRLPRASRRRRPAGKEVQIRRLLQQGQEESKCRPSPARSRPCSMPASLCPRRWALFRADERGEVQAHRRGGSNRGQRGLVPGDSLARHPEVFDSSYISMVRSGETGRQPRRGAGPAGRLHGVGRQAALQGHGAMIYPVIMLVVASASWAS